MKTKIFVIAHKECKMYNIKDYIPLQVGTSINVNVKTNYLKDDVGDNISSKNRHFCELTGLYWLWKNYSDVDIIGICHYRRFFSKKTINTNEKYFLSSYEVETILNEYDMILPTKLSARDINIYEHFAKNSVTKEDIENTKKVMEKFSPEYLEEFNNVLEGKYLSFANMMITNKKMYNQYCEWLFKILFKVEEITDYSNRTQQQMRVYGYLSEILLNVWVNKNKIKVKYLPVVQTENKHNISYYIKLVLEKFHLYNFLHKKFKK